MKIINYVNSYFIAFIVEMIALGSVFYLGYQVNGIRFVKVLLGVGLVAIFAVIWGLFFSPKASYRLEMPYLFIGKLLLLLIPTYILFMQKNMLFSIAWAILIIGHLLLGSWQGHI